MQKIEFTNEEWELLKELLVIIKKIEVYYKEMYLYEITNKKNSNECKKIRAILKVLIDREEELYKKISVGTNFAYLEYLFSGNPPIYEDSLEYIKYDLDYKLIKLRLASRLSGLLSELDFEVSEGNYFDEDFKNDIVFENIIFADIINSVMLILNNYIDDKEYFCLKNKLIKFKYDCSFVSKELEKDFIKYNFEIDSEITWKYNIFSEIYNKDNEIVQSTINDFIDAIIENQLNDIKSILNSILPPNKKMEQIILNIILLRACMLFLTNEEVNMLKNSIELELLLTGGVDPSIENAFEDLFVERIEDSEYVRILFFDRK